MKSLKLTTALILGGSLSLLGEVMIYDGFTDATNPLANSEGGFGWQPTGEIAVGGWAETVSSGGIVLGSSPSVVSTGNLAAPSDYGFLDGSTSDTDADGSFISNIFDAPRSTGQYTATRHFSEAARLNMAADTTFYFSFLWMEEVSEDGVSPDDGGTGEGGLLEVDFLGDGTFSRRVWEFRTSNGEISMDFGNAAAAASNSISFTPGESYLLVGKVEAYADELTADVVSVSIFQNGTAIGSEPTVWQMTGEVLEGSDRSRLIDRVGLKGSGSLNQFDELIIGTSFVDVTGLSDAPDYGEFSQYPLTDGWANTEEWLGWVYVLNYPWVYIDDLSSYVYAEAAPWIWIKQP